MKRSPRIVAIAALALALTAAACGHKSTNDTASSSPGAARRDAGAASNAFAVEVSLSPAARERLGAQHESLIVSADYFGEPSAEAIAQRVPGSENPWLTLHRAQVELEGATLDGNVVARFPAVSLDAKQLAWTDAPDAPQVNVNVYSGRRSSPDNLLDCGMFQDTLAVAAQSPVRISCGLIGEPGERR
ncbi:hypothetical protein [Lysobacter auxotrophicus]|uniref:Lipoprotein n=1 Tax=Lysobacter auxotrophicus TaxID=2992573 RepID=A0ABM8DI81_9GAMM|nr:hypothetical protein [Lysobacter auxotrophicus]BDU18366.1 hypothetical protein LA521A_35670 [Lysobacter auxotrophicus]